MNCILFAVIAHSALAEKGYFILVATKQPADVLMMREHHQESRSYGKQPVTQFFGIVENENDEQWKGNTCCDGTQGNVACKEQHEHKNSDQAHSHKGLYGKYHSEQGCDALTTTKIGPDREDVAENGCKTQEYLEVHERLTGPYKRGENRQFYRQEAFQHIADHYATTGPGTQYTECICCACISAAMLADVYTIHLLTQTAVGIEPIRYAKTRSIAIVITKNRYERKQI